jgi:hypothetical protein
MTRLQKHTGAWKLHSAYGVLDGWLRDLSHRTYAIQRRDRGTRCVVF